MAKSTVVSCPKNTWTLVAEGMAKLDIMPLNNSPNYLVQYVNSGEAAPTDLSKAAPVFNRSDVFSINNSRVVDVYIYPIRENGSVLVYNNTGVHQNTTLFQRPLSTNGLPGGTVSLDVDGSTTPVPFYIEALTGERLQVSRFMVSIRSTTTIDINQYGDLAALTNGIQVYFEEAAGPLAGQKIDLLHPLTIKRNEDWGRWSFDSVPIPVGATNKTNTWQSRWTLTKYGNPFGIVLEEGDKLGVIVNDDLSGLVEHTVIAEGVHLSDVNPAWISLIP